MPVYEPLADQNGVTNVRMDDWIEQCYRSQVIKRRFGVENALQYLVGQKLLSFLYDCEQDPRLLAAMPQRLEDVQAVFTSDELAPWLASSRRFRKLNLVPENGSRLEQLRLLMLNTTPFRVGR